MEFFSLANLFRKEPRKPLSSLVVVQDCYDSSALRFYESPMLRDKFYDGFSNFSTDSSDYLTSNCSNDGTFALKFPREEERDLSGAFTSSELWVCELCLLGVSASSMMVLKQGSYPSYDCTTDAFRLFKLTSF